MLEASLLLGDDEGSDLRFGLGPNTTTGSKTLNEAAVLHGREPKSELTHAAVGEKSIDFREKRRVHKIPIARFSVCVKPHATTCVPHAANLLARGMGNSDWETRLRQAIQERWLDKGRSLNELSARVDMGPNYVSQMLTTTKAPKAETVIKLADALGVSLTWIYLGADLTAEDEQLLQLAAKVDTTQKRQLLDLLNSIAAQKP